MDQDPLSYLTSTTIIDSDHAGIRDYAQAKVKKRLDPVRKAVRLYLSVRDEIWYDPYTPFHLPDHYRASSVLERGRGFCVPKASLLCALGRACGIPSRVGFADVRNHLASKKLIDFLGTDLFVYHGFVEFYLEGKWVKATPAFNAELCRRHHVPPLEFNGREDSLFQAYSLKNRRFMEYVRFHGVEADIPIDRIVKAWRKTYGKNRVKNWIKGFEETEAMSLSPFKQGD